MFAFVSNLNVHVSNNRHLLGCIAVRRYFLEVVLAFVRYYELSSR